MRSVVVLPQPEGPSRVTSVPGSMAKLTSSHRGRRAVALGDARNSMRAARRRPLMPRARLTIGAGAAPRRPSRRSPTSHWISGDRRHHQHDQHRAVGEGDAVVAVDDAADDVGRRQLVLGGDQEDHRADRGHRAHEAVDQRGHQGRLEQRQDHAAQGREPAARPASRRPRRGAVDLAQRGQPAAHADRQVAEHEAEHDDQPGAGQLDRRHVEGEDVADAEHRAGNREASSVRELEGRRPAKRWRASS